MKLFVVFETGPAGKKANRVFLQRVEAQRFLRESNPHLHTLEELDAPSGYCPPGELFAAHSFDAGYQIHRFTGMFSEYEAAKEKAGPEGLVLLLVPES